MKKLFAFVAFSFCLFSNLYARAAITPVETQKLDNGITFITRSDKLSPRIAISLLVPAGLTDETKETAGWRRLLAETMLRATQNKNEGAVPGEAVLLSRDLTRAAEKLGGEVGASVADDAIEFWIIGDSAKAGELLDLLFTVSQSPRLSEEDVMAARRRLAQREENSSNNRNPAATALDALRTQLYRDADGQPLAYALSGETTTASDELDAAKLRAYHERFFQPNNFTVSAAGDVDKADLLKRLSKIARAESSAPLVAAPTFQAIAADQPPLRIEQEDSPAAYVLVGYTFPNVDPGHPDWAALQILSAALGQSARARLPKRLLAPAPTPALPAAEEGEAVASEVSTQLTPRRFASELVIVAQTDAQSVNGVKDAILDEVRRLRDASMSAAELDAAQNYARGDWAVSRQDNRARAFLAGLSALNSSSDKSDVTLPARLEAVSIADVQRVARQYLKNYAVALVMPKY